MNIGDRLRKAREQKNLTAKKLSELSGVPEKNIYRIETGEVKDPRLSSIVPLIKTLGCNADEMLFNKKNQGLSGLLENYLKKTLHLPAYEKAELIRLIEKFLVFNQYEIIGKNKIPNTIREEWAAQYEDERKELEEMIREEEETENDKRTLKQI